jgi:dCMP deaminase
MERITLGECWLAIARTVAKRSPCPDGRRHGAVLVSKDGRMLAAGYNGPAAGEEHCRACSLEADGRGKDWRTCPAVHAEANAVANAARAGVAVMGAAVHCTKQPCAGCRALLRNAGVTEAVFPDEDKSGEAVETNVFTERPIPRDYRSEKTFEDVLRMALERQADGVRRYGRDSYKAKDMHDEMTEELMDVMVYAYLEILKVAEMRDRKIEAHKRLVLEED